MKYIIIILILTRLNCDFVINDMKQKNLTQNTENGNDINTNDEYHVFELKTEFKEDSNVINNQKFINKNLRDKEDFIFKINYNKVFIVISTMFLAIIFAAIIIKYIK